MTDYRRLCIELFGTDDVEKLKKIASRHSAGRKKALSAEDVNAIFKMQRQGMSTSDIALHYGISRQTVSKYLNSPLNGKYVLKIDFMYKQKVCTEIYVDFENRKIKAVNRTDDIMKRAFGVNENPDWDAFNVFLKSRCMPESRDNAKNVLEKIGIDNYDCMRIVEKTNGRTPDDEQYFKFTRKERIAF